MPDHCPVGRAFDLCGLLNQAEDLKVFYLTRRLAALEIDRQAYRDTFGGDAVADFSREFEALEAEQLVEVTGRSIRPTPRGMFYADSIAGLLAFRRLRALRRRRLAAGNSPPGGEAEPVRPQYQDLNGNAHGFM